ncbi:MAG: bifunctional [glutamate--ammonia ligase]-adenylyl-L-tyrosine phosphorylase/[glutamate--ammonia-ligase] adenylyltransferase [Desulfomonilaceae bacterium]
MDRNILEDFINSEANLLHDLINRVRYNHPGIIESSLMDTPNPRLAIIRLEDLLRLDSANKIPLLLNDPETWKCFVTTIGSSGHLFSTLRRSADLISSIFLEKGFSQRKTASQKRIELIDRLGRFDNPTPEDMNREIRRYKEEDFLRIGCRDLSGMADVVQIMAELSDLASTALNVAVDFHFDRLALKHGRIHGLNENSTGFVIFSMGKLSGRELNFSSDIDLIYLRDPEEGWTLGPEKITVSRFYEKLARSVSRSMSDITEDGFVFRVDLRLRPEGDQGELVPSLNNAKEYYLCWGRTWERAALMKAVPIAGDADLGEEFLREIDPFVYRKNLDYSTLDDMRLMKRQIEIHLKKKQGLNIKLGHGGIREIEFFVQTLQLINAGKNPKLRTPSTLKALELLSKGGLLPVSTANDLRDAYLYFRRVEHRIQIDHQLQRHDIPNTHQEQKELACRMGYDGPEALDHFLDDLEKRRKLVEELFSSLLHHASEDNFERVSSTTSHIIESIDNHDEIISTLTDLGFRNPSSTYPVLKHMINPSSRGVVSEKTSNLLERLAPLLLDSALMAPEPEKTIAALDSYIACLMGAPNYYSTFLENPATIRFLVRILGESRFFTELLIRHPESIDSLIGRGSELSFKTPEILRKEILERLDYTENLEDKLNVLRRFKNEETLLIGVRQLNAEIESSIARRLITDLADVCLAASVEIARHEMERKFGSEGLGDPLPFVILGMGKLGGMEMTYMSDLDVIFIYDSPRENIGRLSSREWFSRLANRIISILSVPTAEGAVYAIDTRLRPSGNKGALVSTLESFEEYHSETSALWEKQALIRSKVVTGPPSLADKVQSIVRDCIIRTKLSETDIAEISRIRQRMEKEIALEDSANVDLKTGQGGLVDVEFYTQAQILSNAAQYPELIRSSTLEALSGLREYSLIDQETYESLDSGYRFLTNLEDRLRIMENRSIDRMPLSGSKLVGLAKRLGYGTDGEALIDDYLRIRNKIRAIYSSFFSPIPHGKVG